MKEYHLVIRRVTREDFERRKTPVAEREKWVYIADANSLVEDKEDLRFLMTGEAKIEELVNAIRKTRGDV